MEEKNQLQNSLEDWAQETIEAYHMIAQEVNLAFYTQSDLSILRESPELAIVGINPGGKEKDTYEGQRKNKHWSYLHNNPLELDKNHLLKGNYCHEEGKPSYWEKHKKWSYWSRLKHCLEKTYLKDVIDDDSKIIVTNASFFSTPTAKEISEDLLIKTIPYTLELIEKTTPKHLIFLSGKKCFERLSRLSKSSELVNFEYRHVCGSIYIGRLEYRLNESFNTMKCIGIPHPAYKTNEELNLVASVIPYLINVKGYDDIDVELINKECSKQIEAYRERIINHKKTSGSIDKNQIVIQVISRLMTFFDENSLVEKQEPKLYRFKLNDELILTITSKEQGYIAIRGIDKNNDLTDKYSQILKRFEFLPIDKVWLGKKNFKAFGNSVEEVVNTIVEEVAKIKTETEMN
jgi:hypothetical protein